MQLHPEEIRLDAEQQKRIAALAEEMNKPWEEVLREAIETYFQAHKDSRSEATAPRRRAGSARGKIRMAPDFDAPLEDFKDYM